MRCCVHNCPNDSTQGMGKQLHIFEEKFYVDVYGMDTSDITFDAVKFICSPCWEWLTEHSNRFENRPKWMGVPK